MAQIDYVLQVSAIVIGVILLFRAGLRYRNERDANTKGIVGVAGPAALPVGSAFAMFGVALLPLSPPSDFAAPFEATAECRTGEASGPSTPQTGYIFRGIVKQKVGKAFNVVFQATGAQPGPYVFPLTSTFGTDGITTLNTCGSIVENAKGQVSACANADKDTVTVSWSIPADKASSPLIRLRIPGELLPGRLIGPGWQCRVRENGQPLRDAAGQELVVSQPAGKARFGNTNFEADLHSGDVQFNPDITPTGLSVYWDAILEALDTIWGKVIGGVAGAATILAGIRILWRWYRRRHSAAASSGSGGRAPSSPSPRRSGSAGNSARRPSRSG